MPKKKARRRRQYREGGGAVPFLLVLLFSSTGYYAYAKQPWKDGFEDIRVNVLGQPPKLRLEGVWEVTKLIDPPGKTNLPARPATSGTVTFSKKGEAKFMLLQDDRPWKANAKYEQGEAALRLTGLKASPDCGGPTNLSASLTDVGVDDIVISFKGSGALYLHRLEGRKS